MPDALVPSSPFDNCSAVAPEDLPHSHCSISTRRNSLDRNPRGTLRARILHREVEIQVQCVEFASAAPLVPSPPSVL